MLSMPFYMVERQHVGRFFAPRKIVPTMQLLDALIPSVSFSASPLTLDIRRRRIRGARLVVI